MYGFAYVRDHRYNRRTASLTSPPSRNREVNSGAARTADVLRPMVTLSPRNTIFLFFLFSLYSHHSYFYFFFFFFRFSLTVGYKYVEIRLKLTLGGWLAAPLIIGNRETRLNYTPPCNIALTFLFFIPLILILASAGSERSKRLSHPNENEIKNLAHGSQLDLITTLNPWSLVTRFLRIEELSFPTFTSPFPVEWNKKFVSSFFHSIRTTGSTLWCPKIMQFLFIFPICVMRRPLPMKLISVIDYCITN